MKLKLQPTWKQHLALQTLQDKVTEYILFGGGANGGKSWLGCLWLLIMCLMYPETRWFIGREELKRLKESTLVTFFKVCAFYCVPADYWKYNAQDHFILFYNGSRIDLLDLKYLPSDPLYERYGSVEYTGGWIEEAGEIHFDAFDTLKSRINRFNNDKYGILGKIFLTCNPKRNWLYNVFYKPFKAGKLPLNMAFIQSLIIDNLYREEGAIKKLQGITNKAKRERLLFGKWEYEDEPDQLIPYDALERAIEVPHVPGKKCLGVDVARFGDDDSVTAMFSGNMLDKVKAYTNYPINKVAEMVLQEIRNETIDADRVGVDSVGLGGGVVDIVRASGYRVQEIISGEKAYPLSGKDPYYYDNLRSQMWWVFREELLKGEIKINVTDDVLFEDLTAPRYEISGEQKIKIESKKDIKARIGRSPDKGDAAVYANWMRKKRFGGSISGGIL